MLVCKAVGVLFANAFVTAGAVQMQLHCKPIQLSRFDHRCPLNFDHACWHFYRNHFANARSQLVNLPRHQRKELNVYLILCLQFRQKT